MNLVTLDRNRLDPIHGEGVLYDARAQLSRRRISSRGVSLTLGDFQSFAPRQSAIALCGTYLATRHSARRTNGLAFPLARECCVSEVVSLTPRRAPSVQHLARSEDCAAGGQRLAALL